MPHISSVITFRGIVWAMAIVKIWAFKNIIFYSYRDCDQFIPTTVSSFLFLVLSRQYIASIFLLLVVYIF